MSFPDSHDSDAETHTGNSFKAHGEKILDHVMTFGTFDIFHPGHVFYLSEAQKFAKKMTVVIARDARVLTGKGRNPVDDENVRLSNVEKSFPDANVILGDEVDMFAPIRTLHPDILAFGYDQRVPEEKLHELFPTLEFVRICGHETEKWKSSLLRSEQTKNKD